MYLYQIVFIITIQLETDLLLEISVLQTIEFSVAGKHIATRRQLHVEERAGFSVNCYRKKITDKNHYNSLIMHSL